MQNPSDSPTRFPSHILCGLDLEGRASHAVNAAVWLSERLGTPLELVHAFPPRPLLWGKEADMPEWVAGTEAVGRVVRESLRVILAQAPAELGLRTGADALRFHISSGHPVHVILERARTARADLIVLGPHQKHGGLDFGNTVRGVLAHAPHGVWMQPGKPTLVRRILVPIDLSPDSLRALAIACDLAQRFDARITALQAFEVPVLGASLPENEVYDSTYVLGRLLDAERGQFESAMSSFDWRGVPHESRFERGDPAQVVLALQDAHDLVVMGTHGRTGLSAALLGAVAHSVLRAARIPVLALRHARSTYLL